MSAWWTYSISDLLLFSPRVYRRMMEAANAEAWPAQLLFALIGVLVVVAIAGRSPRLTRVSLVLLAGVWAFVAWFFFSRHYGMINWAASWFVVAFALQAALLLAASVVMRPSLSNGFGVLPVVIALVGLAGVPALTWATSGRLDVFGVAPEPTAIVTLALASCLRGGAAIVLMIIPIVWCVVGGLTLYAMDDAAVWLPPACAVLGVLARFSVNRDERSRRV